MTRSASSAEDAYADENGKDAYHLIANRYVKWLREIIAPTFE